MEASLLAAGQHNRSALSPEACASCGDPSINHRALDDDVAIQGGVASLEHEPVSSYAFHAKNCLSQFKTTKAGIVDALERQRDVEVELEKERERAKTEVDKYLMEVLRVVEQTQSRLHAEIDAAVDQRHKQIQELREVKARVDAVLAQATTITPNEPQFTKHYLMSKSPSPRQRGDHDQQPNNQWASSHNSSPLRGGRADENLLMFPAASHFSSMLANESTAAPPSSMTALVSSEQKLAHEAMLTSKLLRKHEGLIAPALKLVETIRSPLKLKFRRQLCALDLAALSIKDVSSLDRLVAERSTTVDIDRTTRSTRGKSSATTQRSASSASHVLNHVGGNSVLVPAAAAPSTSVTRSLFEDKPDGSGSLAIPNDSRSASAVSSTGGRSRSGGMGGVTHRQVVTPLVPVDVPHSTA